MKTICVAVAVLIFTAASASAEWRKLTHPQLACDSVANFEIAATLSQQEGATQAQIEGLSGCRYLPVGTEVLAVQRVGTMLSLSLVKIGEKTYRVITPDYDQ
ncbi:hypothetical protein [Methylopila sp. 73B]|uniref:hypothetical protein n=1 Tax=Methylopila sp. 73B TaxID=1120792 RepID=UPI000372AF40|nr:hypothetical protein [Methylopila sp. 73B]